MEGYEKVNKRVATRPVNVAPLAGDHLIGSRSLDRPKRRSKKSRRFVDFRTVAAESPAESIAREREIVAWLAR